MLNRIDERCYRMETGSYCYYDSQLSPSFSVLLYQLFLPFLTVCCTCVLYLSKKYELVNSSHRQCSFKCLCLNKLYIIKCWATWIPFEKASNNQQHGSLLKPLRNNGQIITEKKITIFPTSTILLKIFLQYISLFVVMIFQYIKATCQSFEFFTPRRAEDH